MLVPLIYAVLTDRRKLLKSKYQLRSQEISPSRQGYFLFFFAWHSPNCTPKDDLGERNGLWMADRRHFCRAIVKNLAHNGPSRFAPNPFAFCNESQTHFATNKSGASPSAQLWDEPEAGTRRD
jgi:hypothetical protein